MGLHNYVVHISSPIVPEILSAENSSSPASMIDIEGNFMLTSTQLCLKEIRKMIVGFF